MLSLMTVAIGCSRREHVMLDREAIRRSVESAAAMIDPVTQKNGSEELDELLRGAIRESARVEARLEWWPFTERTDLVAWSRVAHLASARARDIRMRRSALEHEWSVVSSRAEEVLEEVESHPIQPPSPKASAAARKAAVELDLARSLAGGDRVPDAVAAAIRSIEASERFLAERDRRLARFDDPNNLRTWGSWVSEAVRQSAVTRSAAIVVDKLERRLYLYESGTRRMTFEVELGSGALARKLHQGDRATPEGRYRVREVRGPGETRYHRALLLDYPNDEDWNRFRAAKARGEISSRARIGGLIEIHGEGGQGGDWTEGCVALSNEEMDKLVKRVKVGTPVTIVGRIP
jgi:hypothetical protein